MDRTVDILPEKDKLTVNVCSIRDRTRGVTWAVNGCHSTATDSKGRFLALQSDIDGKWFEVASIPGGAGHTVVARFEINRIQLMSHDSAAIFISHGLGPTSMIEVTVSQQKVFELRI